jgi:AraC-like DNA-binding protein
MQMVKNYSYKEHSIPVGYEKYFARLWEFSIKNDLPDKKWGSNSLHLPNICISRIKGKHSIVLNGPLLHKQEMPSYGDTLIKVIVLKPYLIKQLFDVSNNDISGRSIPLGNLNSPLIDINLFLPLMSGLFERLFSSFGSYLSQIHLKPYDEIISNAVDDFILSKGKIKPGDYIKTLPMSERQFQRRFKLETGMNAMTFLKNLKVSNLSRELLKNDFEDKGVVFDYGYFDHPHYIKDFKGFHGCSPMIYRDRFKVVKFDLV